MLAAPMDDGQACLRCHGGVSGDAVEDLAPGVRPTDVGREFAKPYRHPIETAHRHDRGEVLPEVDSGTPRHVSCLDCHDAHYPVSADRFPDKDSKLRTKARPSSLRGVTYQYELCYRCHGDSANLPGNSRNVRADFSLSNRSYHPVEGAGTSTSVPSLRSPFSAASVIGCTDCHGGDRGEGISAPHGSAYAGLLRFGYSTLDGQLESQLTYALCYRCHDRSSILGDESFAYHRLHLTKPTAQSSCHTCHDSHGSKRNPYLIRFNPVAVFPTQSGRLRYISEGNRRGECYLICHEFEHEPGRYCPPNEPCDRGRVERVDRSRKMMTPQDTGRLWPPPPGSENNETRREGPPR